MLLLGNACTLVQTRIKVVKYWSICLVMNNEPEFFRTLLVGMSVRAKPMQHYIGSTVSQQDSEEGRIMQGTKAQDLTCEFEWKWGKSKKSKLQGEFIWKRKEINLWLWMGIFSKINILVSSNSFPKILVIPLTTKSHKTWGFIISTFIKYISLDWLSIEN